MNNAAPILFSHVASTAKVDVSVINLNNLLLKLSQWGFDTHNIYLIIGRGERHHAQKILKIDFCLHLISRLEAFNSTIALQFDKCPTNIVLFHANFPWLVSLAFLCIFLQSTKD